MVGSLCSPESPYECFSLFFNNRAPNSIKLSKIDLIYKARKLKVPPFTIYVFTVTPIPSLTIKAPYVTPLLACWSHAGESCDRLVLELTRFM